MYVLKYQLLIMNSARTNRLAVIFTVIFHDENASNFFFLSLSLLFSLKNLPLEIWTELCRGAWVHLQRSRSYKYQNGSRRLWYYRDRIPTHWCRTVALGVSLSSFRKSLTTIDVHAAAIVRQFIIRRSRSKCKKQCPQSQSQPDKIAVTIIY